MYSKIINLTKTTNDFRQFKTFTITFLRAKYFLSIN